MTVDRIVARVPSGGRHLLTLALRREVAILERVSPAQGLVARRSGSTTEEDDMKECIAFVAVAVFAAVGLSAEPLAWPQFRGPNGSGVADGQKPPVELGP